MVQESDKLNDDETAVAVYRAMRPLEPADARLGHPTMKSLIDNMRMQQDRDHALAEIAALREANEAHAAARCDQARIIAAKDARIAELDTRLAMMAKSQTESDKKPPAPPKPFPAGSLAPKPKDQRRIGS